MRQIVALATTVIDTMPYIRMKLKMSAFVLDKFDQIGANVFSMGIL